MRARGYYQGVNRDASVPMQIYLVGGAVRNRLLGLPIKDRDWVCVGARVEEMLNRGYRQVGREFPVFIHPSTGEEYALARTERKIGQGHQGFSTDASPSVGLEEDLSRRDLTINAIAQADDGALIDPYGGQRDIARRVIRHVSAAFAEDPLRVLRTARFAAALAPLGFTVARETLDLMRVMVVAGELDHLTPERVWKETATAMMSSASPSVFFRTLRECGALKVLMPELDRLFGIPQPIQHHPEVDTGLHVMLCIDRAAQDDAPLHTRVAALLHDLGKGVTPLEMLPRHPGHEGAGVPLVETFCERFRVPNKIRELSLAVCEEHLRVHRALELSPKSVVDLLDRLRAFRQPEFFQETLNACRFDAQGRTGLEARAYPQADFLRGAFAAVNQVQARDVLSDRVQGRLVRTELRNARIRRLKGWLREQSATEASPELTF